MAQDYTLLLNKTVYGVGLNAAAATPDSVSVRIEGIQKGTYVELYGIAWGIVEGTAAALAAFDFAELQILRNEKFDIGFQYGFAAAVNTKDVIFQDAVLGLQRFRYIDFAKPLRLDESANYLIIVPAPIDVGTPAQAYNVALTVRGAIIECPPKAALAGDQELEG